MRVGRAKGRRYTSSRCNVGREPGRYVPRKGQCPCDSLDRGTPAVAYARGVRLAAEVAAARVVASLSRLLGRGAGMTVPGKLLSKLDPGAIDRLAARLPAGVAVISATNGKTTTAAMAAEILRPRFRLAHNHSGANLVSGVASTLLAAGGAELGLLEVDEGALPEVLRRVRPRAVCLGNLSRDQLDRYGELELIADRWRTAVSELGEGTILVLNGDDPQIGSLGPGIVYGVDDPAVARPALPARRGLEVLHSLRHAVRLSRRLRRTSGRLPLPELRARAARARRRRSLDRATRPRACVLRPRHAGRHRAGRARRARPLQRLQRARRCDARAGARRLARRDRRWARPFQSRVRPVRAHPGRRQAAASAADQESRRRQRGRTHARRRRPAARRRRRA